MSITQLFPDLEASGFKETSPKTGDYNCIAWAAGEDQRWWDPMPGYYWPDDVERKWSVKSLIDVFRTLGYEHCPSPELEPGYEKVAIYAVGASYTHAARQLPSGAWTSKIGGMQDIEHASLEGLNGSEYGAVVCVMRRKT